MVPALLKHPGSGRLALVLRVESFKFAEPVSLPHRKYVLVVGSEKVIPCCSEKVAREWIDAGASYVCAWGQASGAVEAAFDHASFLPEFGNPLPFTLMTTSHPDEPLEEALWFAFYNATPPDDLPHELDTVVVVVDSAALGERCVTWIQENSE